MSEQKNKQEESSSKENQNVNTNDGITREWMELNDGSKVPVAKKFSLSDGRTVKIAKGLAKHSMAAQEESVDETSAKGDTHKYQAALLSLLISIDDKFFSSDDWLNMDMSTYNKIFPSFAEVNF